MILENIVDNKTEQDLTVSLCVLNDNLSVDTVERLLQEQPFDPGKIVIIIDQIVPPNSPAQSHLQRLLMRLGEEQNIPVLFGRTMTAQYVAAQVGSDEVAVAAVPTIAAAGIHGGLGICVSEEELLAAYAQGTIKIRPAGTKRVCLETALPEQASVKDLALYMRKAMGDSANGKILALSGQGVDALTDEELTELFVMLAASGAVAITRGDGTEITCSAPLDNVGEYVARGRNAENITRVDRLDSIKINTVFIGGAAGGGYENIRLAADMLQGRQIAYGVRLAVAPATAAIYEQIANEGIVSIILDAGGLVLNQCANPSVQFRLGPDEIMVSNDWIAGMGYAGYETSETILTSTRTAVQAALDGHVGSKRTPVVEGRCWTMLRDDIDTDIIIPTQYVTLQHDEMLTHVFEPLRPELAALLREGDIIVAGDNFGCGSSREMAAEALADNGVKCVIAGSFARIFFRNAINNGILLIENSEIQKDIKEGDIVRVEINKQIVLGDKTYPIGKIQDNIYEIIADGGLVKHTRKRVENGEL